MRDIRAEIALHNPTFDLDRYVAATQRPLGESGARYRLERMDEATPGLAALVDEYMASTPYTLQAVEAPQRERSAEWHAKYALYQAEAARMAELAAAQRELAEARAAEEAETLPQRLQAANEALRGLTEPVMLAIPNGGPRGSFLEGRKKDGDTVVLPSELARLDLRPVTDVQYAKFFEMERYDAYFEMRASPSVEFCVFNPETWFTVRTKETMSDKVEAVLADGQERAAGDIADLIPGATEDSVRIAMKREPERFVSDGGRPAKWKLV